MNALITKIFSARDASFSRVAGDDIMNQIPMEFNIWFYTFSTAAQVMAALVGLFAVFVVYKIQDFGTLLAETRQAVIEIIVFIGSNTRGYQSAIRIQDAVPMDDSEILRRFKELLDIKVSEPQRVTVDQTINLGLARITLDGHTYQFYKNLVTKRGDILRRLRRILLESLLAIACALTALTMTSSLIPCFELILGAYLIYLLFCLYEIGRGVYEITIQ